MTSEPARRTDRWQPDEDDLDAIRRHLADPDVKARIRAALEDMRASKDAPGVTAEELPEFLRGFE